ncbi:hypothetical protein JYU12_02680 [bacterium AH-315-K03]|nr:hypothetical protein [bacterium AH-315-K03]
MQDSSNLLIIVAGELVLVLLLVCLFLCFQISRLKKLIAKLEEKIRDLRKTVGVVRKDSKALLGKLTESNKVKPREFLEYLEEEIDHTLAYHKSLEPDRDIVLDIAPDAPLDRQASSLRHAFLIAEKEARFAGEDDQSSWDVLQAKFQQIIQFYVSAAPAQEPDEGTPDAELVDEERAQEIENYKKQIENLGRYKKLFFDVEDKWQTAKTQADEYYKQLMAKSKELSDDGEFEALLKNYSHAYDDIDGVILEATKNLPDEQTQDDGQMGTKDVGVGKTVIANQDEINRLKNMAVDQHKVITELKRKLVDAKSPEQQKEAMDELAQQLDHQQRFLKEAETCTQLIENELSRAIEENEELRDQLSKAGGGEGEGEGVDDEQVEKLESLVGDLTDESKEMLRTIAALEDENKSIKKQLESGGGLQSSEEAGQLKEKLSEVQQELLNMQTQHIELEERYLELKMGSV